jgi:hypothetical protein
MRLRSFFIVPAVAVPLLLGRAAPVLAQAVPVAPAAPSEPADDETPIDDPEEPPPAPPVGISPLQTAPAPDPQWAALQESASHKAFTAVAAVGGVTFMVSWGLALVTLLALPDPRLVVPVVGPLSYDHGFEDYVHKVGVVQSVGVGLIAVGYLGYRLTLPSAARGATVSVVPAIGGDVRALALNVSW